MNSCVMPDDIVIFFRKYYENLIKIKKTEKEMLLKSDNSDAWLLNFNEKSKLIRAFYIENEIGLNKYCRQFIGRKKTLTNEIINAIIQGIMSYPNMEVADTALMYNVTRTFAKYYKDIDDINNEIFHNQLHINSGCKFSILQIDECEKYIETNMSYLEKYNKLNDIGKYHLIITFLDWMNITAVHIPDMVEKKLYIYDKFHLFINNIEIPDDKFFADLILKIKDEFDRNIADYNNIVNSKAKPTEYEMQKMYNMTVKMYEASCNETCLGKHYFWNEKNIILWNLELGKIDNCEAFDKLVLLYEELLKIIKNEKSFLDKSFLFFTDIFDYTYYISILADKLKKTEIISDLMDEIKGIIKKVINEGYSGSYENIDGALAEIVKDIDKHFLNEDISDAVLGFTVYRQAFTCVHSIMVSNLAISLFSAYYDKSPSAFSSIKDTLIRYDWIDHEPSKDELSEYVGYAALYHDIGKVYISGVINQQARKLTDDEYEQIKAHAELGNSILLKVKHLNAYSQIALLHHRSFDGKNGYPENIDNTKSPLKLIIDIVSICDSIDSATDILGRNYTYKKTFLMY